MQQVNKPEMKSTVQESDGTFKFTLISNIEEQGLKERLTIMMSEITAHGKKLGKHMDVRDMRRYRALIKDFMNEIGHMSFQERIFLTEKEGTVYMGW